MDKQRTRRFEGGSRSILRAAARWVPYLLTSWARKGVKVKHINKNEWALKLFIIVIISKC